MTYLLELIESLRMKAAESSQNYYDLDARKSHTAQYKPLTEQIIELMKSTPPQLLNRPWSMAELVARLDGKYQDRPHAQNVGQALRIIGWNYRRYWTKGFNGARLWTPPDI
jgi:transposase